ncbi:kelch domain-containing protein 2 [Hydra vulgaris]|uniref:Kelch domain-containing protein 2 n=1 Tax=Hydra vulgaris TaxID=6087 RepID=A0ABM4DID9_HYDVU
MSFFIPTVYGDIPKKRSGHAAVFFNGQLIVFGGYGDSDEEDIGLQLCKNIWSYNIEISQWTKHVTKGKYPGKSTGSSAILLGHNVYLFGGFYKQSGQTNKLYCLDLTSLTWSELTEQVQGDGPSAKDKMCSWKIDNKIIYFGGFGAPPNNISQMKGEFYFEEFPQGFCRGFGWNNHLHILECGDVLEWKEPSCVGNRPSPRAAASSSQLGYRGYLFGGRFKEERRNDLFTLDLRTYEWTEIIIFSQKPHGRSWHAMAPISDNHLFVYGGFDNNGNALKDVWIFNCENKTWNEKENATSSFGVALAPRMWHTACNTDQPGEIIVFGGCSNSILSYETCLHTNSVAFFRFSPLSLQKMCTDYIIQHYNIYRKSIELLPKMLRWAIDYRYRMTRNNPRGKLVKNCTSM